MGNCASSVIQAIPDKEVMLEVVDRIVEFEQMLKRGESLTREQQKEKQKLEPVARELKRAQKRGVVHTLDLNRSK